MLTDGEAILDRMVRAVERVRDRLRRATALLEEAGIPYAVVDGNAVAYWVATVDEAAVRNTQDVDILIRREDLERAKEAFAAAGFIYRHVKGIDMFLDGRGAKARDAVHILYAGEPVRLGDAASTPQVHEAILPPPYRVLELEALVRMKLTANRDKDRTHIRDLIEVELIDETWPGRMPDELAERLRTILDTPEG